jgi:hypothetical protein
MWNPNRKGMWAVLLLAASLSINAQAATITAMVQRVTGAWATGAVISFYPSNTPAVINGGYTLSPSARMTVSSNGWASNTLVTGNYRFSVDQSTRDFGTVWIPDDANTYNLWGLLTSSNVLFNTNISAAFPTTVQLNGTNLGTGRQKINLIAGTNVVINGTNNASSNSFDVRINAASSSSTATNLSPIGSIVAWLKSFSGTPALPAGWVEMNGQVLSDASSVYNGATIPNLNGSGYFLRGSTTSGSTGGSETHTHSLPVDATTDPISSLTPLWGFTTQPATNDPASSLPPYYEIVWIMRVR